MAQSVYFDTEEVSGFTFRTFLEENAGIVKVTNIQLRSRTYGGPTWNPGGEIAVNGKTLLEMNYNDPATHAFNVYSAGESFIDVQKLTGQALPVTSDRITAAKATITVNVTLYRNSSSARPKLTGSYSIDIASVLAMVNNGSAFQQKQAAINNGTTFKKYRPIVHDGASWST